MKRRTFLKRTIPAAVLPFMLNGLPLRAFGKGSVLEAALRGSADSKRVLVIIELHGGNDGLNTVIPLDQYKNLASARANILIPENKILPLNNSSITGLHPSLPGIQSLYNNQMATIIQGVGYPDFVYSHFRAADIWHTGSDGNTMLTSGWLGRYLDRQYTDYPKGYPNSKIPDPLAICIGNTASTVMLGPTANMSLTIDSDSDFYNLVTGVTDTEPDTPLGYELAYIREISKLTQKYNVVIQAAAQARKNLSTLYPRRNPLADQLKIIAQLVGGGLQTQVYFVTLHGFDFHFGQADTSDTTKGGHATLLQQVSEAIAAFQDDLHLMGQQDNVLAMTFSEFGRRIMSNASYGTDHGSAKPVFLFGSQLKGGLIGVNPEIPAKVGVRDNLEMQVDHRSVFASVLKGWFNVPNDILKIALPGSFQILDLFKS